MSDQSNKHRDWWGDPHEHDSQYYEHYDDDGFALGMSPEEKAKHNRAFGGLLLADQPIRIYKDYTPEISELVRAKELPINEISLTTLEPQIERVDFRYHFRIVKKEPIQYIGVTTYRDTPGTAYVYPAAISRIMIMDDYDRALQYLLLDLARKTLSVLMDSDEVLIEDKRRLDPYYDMRKAAREGR